MKFPKIDLLLIILIVLISFFTWRHIPSLQFTGESWGFVGTIPPKGNIFEIIFQEFTPLNEFTIDRILSGILLPVFKDQIQMYMWFQLIYMLTIDLLVYTLVRYIAGSKAAAFLSVFLFSVGFIGKFDTYSGGGYLYFAGRATLVIPELVAILFLHLYLVKSFKFYNYIISFASYLFALVMGFFGTFFVPIFILYPIVYFLFNLKKSKEIFWKLIWVPVPYILATLFIIKGSLAITNESIVDFVFNKFSYVATGIIQQLAVMTFPMGELFKIYNKQSIEYFFILIMTVILYSYAFLTDFKKNKQMKIIQATALLSAIAMLLLNVYIQAAETLNTIGSTRYFYFPSIFIAIFWGIYLESLFKKKNKLPKIILAVFLIIWFMYNNIHIERRLKDGEWLHRANRQTLEILRSWAPETTKKPSYMFLPASLGGYGSGFAYHFFSHADGKTEVEGLETLDLAKLAKSGLNPNNLYVMHFDTITKNVIDKTEESRNELIKLQIKR